MWTIRGIHKIGGLKFGSGDRDAGKGVEIRVREGLGKKAATWVQNDGSIMMGMRGEGADE